MKLKLPDSIASLQDLASVISEIKDYSRWFAHEAIKKRAGAKHSSEPPELSAASVELLRDLEKKKNLNQTGLDDLTAELTSFSKTAPSITITLADTPSGSIKIKLVDWCRNNIAPNILVNFQLNSSILGGMVVRYGSQIFDWSFRRKILNNQNKFPEVLRNV